MRKRDHDYFSEWLERTLRNEKISGGEVAKAVGVAESAVSRWRNGQGAPSIDSCMRLANFLKVNPIRLAVTAGLMRAQDVGLERLPLPEDKARDALVREQVMKMRGLTDEERVAVLKTLGMEVER
ncbi:helix-turn-helix domain-containing protein [Streptomyces sp. NPDC015131]|uniref:helix-turn-helix domain-containing protein n=1 Tax=Streptomyces sp. NPDC015131 TaxID=3364941 RepID=UPI0036F74151